jgi:large subunit ribosomal protein L28
MFSIIRPLVRHQRASAKPFAYSASNGAITPNISPLVDLQQRFRSNRSRRGLYDGKDIRSGNNVSFSMKSTKRKFKPNVFLKRVYSEILDEMVQFHLTTSALRSIDKAGGLDNYLMKNEFTEGEGFEVKRKIMKRLKNQARYERKAEERSAA